jgi:hypothetical protein
MVIFEIRLVNYPGQRKVRFGLSAVLSVMRLLPIFPRKQTSRKAAAMSQKCHVWTAPSWQELFSRFAALVGAAMCSAF